MKRPGLFILAFSMALASLAEEPRAPAVPDNVIQASTATASSGKRYIKDYILVPLRSGDTPGHRIVHKGIKSGTAVSLLKNNEASQYSLVKTAEGIEGWIPSHYLMEEEPSSIRLQQAEELIRKLQNQAGPDAINMIDLQGKNDELLKNLRALEETNNTLSRELEHIKSLSADELKLNEENKNLLTQYETAKRQQDTLLAENQSLTTQLRQNTFINGAIAVILGILATLSIQYFARSKKRYSDWA